MRESAGVTKNSKSQISNNKQITMTKIQNLFWSFDIGIWDFIDSSTPKQLAIFTDKAI
jgi:hypothetical protein